MLLCPRLEAWGLSRQARRVQAQRKELCVSPAASPKIRQWGKEEVVLLGTGCFGLVLKRPLSRGRGEGLGEGES